MDIEATRKAMGLSRKQLAEKAGVTESAVWSVEHGKNPRGGEEVRQAVLAVLDPLSSSSETPASEPVGQPSTGAKPTYASRGGKRLAAPEPRADWKYSYEWDGMTSGDPCKVNGEPGTAKFIEHVVTEKGATHCTVIMDGKWRSFAPDRVHATQRRKRRGPGDGTNGVTDWTVEVLTVAGETHSLTFATYHDARVQGRVEVEHGGKVKIINYHGTVVEVMPFGWAPTVGEPAVVTS